MSQATCIWEVSNHWYDIVVMLAPYLLWAYALTIVLATVVLSMRDRREARIIEKAFDEMAHEEKIEARKGRQDLFEEALEQQAGESD